MQETTGTKSENCLVNCKKKIENLFYPYNIYDFLRTLKNRIKVICNYDYFLTLN